MTLNFTPIQTSILSCETEEDKQINSLNQQSELLPKGKNKREKKTELFPFGECRICHDSATGVHYGVITCEGCKGFFKRCIVQGFTHHCFFGDKCVINIQTRNRCKACRYNRCVEQGMSMDSVKLGRIPKSIKVKALREHYKRQEINTNLQTQNEEIQNITLAPDDECDKSNQMFESISSINSSNVNTQQSNDTSPEIVVISSVILNSPKESFRTIDLIELTISSPACFNNNDLSLLRLPTVFNPSSETLPNSIKLSNDLSRYTPSNSNTMTVLTYISNINENTLIDYMFNCELRYSKNVLQIMKYLLPKLCQPFLIYELDFELMSFFRYIRWKMLNFYIKHTIRVRMLVQRMFGIINLGITDYPGVNTTSELMWTGVQLGISEHVKELLAFAQDTPGLNELNLTDFTRIMNNRVFDFWITINYPLFYQNETYIMTPNGLQYTRFFMSKFIGKTTTNALHEFSERLHSLNITQIEHSLMIPIVICQPDQQLKDPEHVHIIKHCYMYALYIQLCSTRTEDEAKILFNNILEIIDSIQVLNELCKKNIGEIVLDKTTTCK